MGAWRKWNPDQLRKMVNAGMSNAEMAAVFECSRYTVREALKRFGIKRQVKTLSDTEVDQAIVDALWRRVMKGKKFENARAA